MIKIIDIINEKVVIELSKEELGVICNTFNEVCNGIEVWEFSARIGVSFGEAKEMLEVLSSTYLKIKSNND